MLTPLNAAVYAQALLLRPAIPTNHFVFFTPSPRGLVPEDLLNLTSGVS